jgi:hypothetical protein
VSNFFDDFTAGIKPEARELSYNNVTKTIYIRQLTAAQKLALERGQAIQVAVGGKKVQADQRMQIDMGDFEAKRHQRIAMVVVDEAGKPLFKNPGEVQLQPARLIAAIDKLVEDVLGGDDPGK